MNDKQITAFISVVENGSFSSAARKQYISPQAMKQQIDLLEQEVGVPLLIRTHQGITLTSGGQAFYKGIVKIHKDLNHLLTKVRTEKKEDSLRLGIFLTDMSVSICNRFSQMYPHIPQRIVNTSEADWLEGLSLLLEDKIDLFEHADVPEIHRPDLRFIPVLKCDCIAALAPDHPLAHKKRLSSSDLIGQSIAVPSKSCIAGLQEYLSAYAPGSTLSEIYRGISPVFDFCYAGGIFILAEIYSEKYKPLTLVPLDIDLSWSFGFVCKKNPRPSVQFFIDAIKDTCSQK
ncbi:MAG: LysR family transcriptional regulator [Alistipes sp.]|nr:LysR family transcriptional regulator [Alistipes sp.]